MKEYKVNDHIILRLENEKTNIYVDGELFNQCKYVLMRKTVDELKDLLEDMDSVDDLEDYLDHSLHYAEPELIDIPPETRFWVHCSNMQVWAENNYDTRFLHSNLSFPLLKKLTELGDSKAKKVFKQEIAKSIERGNQKTLLFLKYNEYLNFLNHEEIVCASLVPEEAEIILELEQLINRKIECMSLKDDLANYSDIYPYYNAQGNHVIILDLSNCKLSEIPEIIARLKKIKELHLGGNDLLTIPETIRKLKNLEMLSLWNNKIQILPEWIAELKSLKTLHLSYNQIEIIPKLIGNMKSLKELALDSNKLTIIPEAIRKLKNLEMLGLSNNKIQILPEWICELEALKSLNIRNNYIKDIPENLKKLEIIYLRM